MSVINNETIRSAIIEALPIETSLHGGSPEQRHVYLPPSHAKALRIECNLVIGGRGVGKTFWSAALHSESIRRLLGTAVPDLPELNVQIGYSEQTNLDDYPDTGTFRALLSADFEAYHVWLAVIGRRLAGIISDNIPSDSWEQTVDWVKCNSESFGRLLENANKYLGLKNKHVLIVFDAIDRLGHDWQTMDKIVRDLLRVVLSLKPFQRVHGKVFLREDQYDKRLVTNFPDASKLLATRVELTWALQDLHGLLLQYLCNAKGNHGTILRQVYEGVGQPSPFRIVGNIWTLTDRAKRDDVLLRSLFAAIAGELMGRGPRRGVPYTWSVGHLADGRGHTSPRSFLAAILTAAEDSQERYPDHSCPLHYESIKRGVQKASEIRVSELAEDYPWVKTLMEPLHGMTVPCSFNEIEDAWAKANSENPLIIESNRLPPEHYDEQGWKGVRSDLISLGIFETMKDGRANMPDLYRVGFGFGRRGGVKPVAKATRE